MILFQYQCQTFYQAVVIYLASNRIGAITTFINSLSSIEEVLGYLNQFESPLFINYDKNSDYKKLEDMAALESKEKDFTRKLKRD